MSHPSALNAAAAATRAFLQGLSPQAPGRVAAKVASAAGMPLLCAVEAVLTEALPAEAARELVWLTAEPAAGHRLQLAAYGQRNELIAEVAHEFAG